jgi:hypothetical protein
MTFRKLSEFGEYKTGTYTTGFTINVESLPAEPCFLLNDLADNADFDGGVNLAYGGKGLHVAGQNMVDEVVLYDREILSYGMENGGARFISGHKGYITFGTTSVLVHVIPQDEPIEEEEE